MFLGSLMLMDTDVPYMNLSLNVIIPTVLLMGALAALVVHLAIRSHKLKVVSGMEGMVGETGTAETNLNPGGKVFLHGEHWAAEVSSPDGDKIKKGGKVVVENIVGLKLIVKKLEN
jgi:membrane-bound serine protease (ClpP class)